MEKVINAPEHQKSAMEKDSSLAPNEPSQRRGLLVTGLIIAMLFGALDGTIVGTAMPRIVGDLGGLGLMTWLTTAYMLTSTVIVPIAGKLADLLGRRLVYVTGLSIFIVASALCGLSQNMTELILFRGLQGIGGGIMMPMAMIIIGDIFTGKQRAKWQGVFGALFGLSSIIGPQVGGWIVDAASWRWVFYINLPVGILAIVLIAIALPKFQRKAKVQFDIAGMVTMIVGVVSLLLALTFGGKNFAWVSWQVIGLIVLAIVSLVSFVRIESKAKEAILPVSLFKNRTFSIVNGVGFLMSVGMFGAIMFVPLFMQGIVGISPAASGTVMTPMMITMIVASVLGGQLVQKIGVRTQIGIGMVIMAVGFVLLTTLSMTTSKLTASGFMMVIGLGMGLVMPLLTLALQESFPKSELGVVTSSSQFFRQIGGTFGMTILGAIMNFHSSKLLADHLVPVLKQIPQEGSSYVSDMIANVSKDPQSLYSVLLNPQALSQMPQALTAQIVPILKSALVDSLHTVFLYGLVFVILGAILSLFVGKVNISGRKGEPEETLNEATS